MVKVMAVIAVCIAVFAALGYFLVIGGGKPIKSDLSVIGNGKPALVLAYENFSPTGGATLTLLRKVRSDFDSELEFVVADLGTPDGIAFADRYQLFDSMAVFLKPDGQLSKIVGIPTDEQSLRSLLASGTAEALQPN